MKSRVTLLALLMFVITSMSFAATRNVPGEYATIQAAINASVAGDIIVVGQGTYFEHVNINKNLTLNGVQAGVDARTRSGNESLINGTFNIADGVTNVTIDGFKFKANSGANELGVGGPYHAAIYGGTATTIATIQNNIMVGATGTAGPSTNPGLVFVTLSSVNFYHNKVDQVSLCNLYTQAAAFITSAGGSATINQNSFTTGLGFITGTNTDVSVTNNLISNGDREGIFIYSTTNTSDFTITGNTVTAFNSCSDPDKNFAFISYQKPEKINGKTITAEMLTALTTDNPGTTSFSLRWIGPVCNVTQDLFYTTIQAAINAANTGNVINVAAGTYNELVSIDKSITLRGAQYGVDARTGRVGANESIIDGSTKGGVIKITGSNVVIDGFTLQGDASVSAFNNGLNCAIHLFQAPGDVTGFQALNNIIQHVPEGIAPRGNLVVIQYNLIRNTDVPGPAGNTGIYSEGLTNALIDNNKFSNVQNTAINLTVGGPGSVNTTNVITNNEMDSQIYLYRETGGEVSGNRITNSFSGGIVLGGENSSFSITNNEINGVANSYGAFRVRNDGPVNSSITVTNNQFNGGLGYGVRTSVDSYSGILNLSNNQISGDAAAIRNDYADLVINATQMWWGDASGPFNATTNPSGTCDAVSNNVNYSPWLGADYTGISHPWTWWTNTNSTIQATINAASTGDIIIVAAGTYTEQINVPVEKSLNIKGNNSGISAGFIPGVRNAESIIDGGFYVNSPSTTIDGFTIKNGYLTGGSTGVEVGASNVIVKNNIIKDCNLNQGNGIECGYNRDNLLIMNNEIFNNFRGIYFNPQSGTTVSGNNIHANNVSGVGIGSDGLSNFTLTGNAITHQTEGWGASTVGANVVAHENSFTDNTVSVANYGGSTIDATNNWWGTVVEATILTLKSGSVSHDPWTGKPVQQSIPPLNIPTEFPGTGTTLNFNTLPPAAAGTITVQTSYTPPAGFPDPPAGVTEAGLYLSINSTMTNYTFSTTITIDVSGIPGFNASTIVMFYNTTTLAWVAVSGTYDAGAHTFSFVTNHFTDFTFINTPETPYDIYLSTSTSAAAGIIYPSTAWGMPTLPLANGYNGAAPDWELNSLSPVSVYLVPAVGSIFSACDVTLEWDITKFAFSSLSDVGGIFENDANFTFIQNNLGNTGQIVLHASRLISGNFTITAGQYIAKLDLTPLHPGFGSISFGATDFRAYDGAGGFQGVYVTPHNASVKFYLGDVADAVNGNSGDGLVNIFDLTPWSGSYWSGVAGFSGGITNYKAKYDVGPTLASGGQFANTVYGIPTMDGKIDFEDLVIFSISYGMSSNHVYPKIPAVSTEPVIVSLGDAVQTSTETLIPLYIEGPVQDIRAMQLSFNGSFGKFVGATNGTLLNSFTTPVVLLSKSEGNNINVDLAIMGTDVQGINGEGEVIMLHFTGKSDVSINGAELRNSANIHIQSSVLSKEPTVPTVFGLDQNYPNPFNPSTSISYQIPMQSHVEIVIFNALGQKVATLVNEVKEAGYYKIALNASNYSSGVYFYRIQSGDFTLTKKMLLMK